MPSGSETTSRLVWKPTVVLLKEALKLLEACGYLIRQECLEGTLGGACAIKGRKVFFLEVRLSPQEQLEVVLKALAEEPKIFQLDISPSLAELLGLSNCSG
ncbi:MAG: hypothetical protein NZ602_06010 [Thermoguttaceae bacterium]|nr:hypothetical protein [Thermoguttaceae bacterium]MDW8038600.1 hypothetical protein [Thermoguttaceae bacterium]